MVSDASDSDPHELRRALGELSIRRLQAAYGDAVSRQAWTELGAMFAPGAPIELDLRDGTTRRFEGGEAIAAFIAGSIERFEFFEFAVLNSVVEVVGDDDATGRLYMWELRQEADGHRWTNAYGLYRDRYVRLEGRWTFADRRYSSLARTAPNGDGMVVFDIPGVER